MKAPERALRRACSILGTQAKLAKALGFKSQGAIGNWLTWGRVPAEHVLAVERVSGVSRHDLRPDIYPPNYPPAPTDGARSAPEAIPPARA